MTSNTKEKAALIIIIVITAAFLAIRFTATIIALRRTAARRKTLGTAALVVACLIPWCFVVANCFVVYTVFMCDGWCEDTTFGSLITGPWIAGVQLFSLWQVLRERAIQVKRRLITPNNPRVYIVLFASIPISNASL